MKEAKVCAVSGCPNGTKITARGLCGAHYTRWKNHGDVQPEKPLVKARACSVGDCDQRAVAHGWCNAHFSRWRKHRDLQPGVPVRRKRTTLRGVSTFNGYRYVTVNGVRRLEHRAIMERLLGRPLLSIETVHHINGDRLDNRPENLELWNKGQPAGQRVDDKVYWAIELLKLYPSEAAAQWPELRRILE